MILKLILSALAVMLVAWLIPGISVESFPTALWVALLVGIINTLIKPILMFIALPINILSLGLFSLVINALLLIFVGNLITGFIVIGFWNAFFGAILLSLLNGIIQFST